MHLALSLLCGVFWLLAFIPAGRGSDGKFRVRFDHPALFLGGFSAVLLVFRWPSFSDPFVYNLDEPQLIAQAMRYLQLPVPWRDVDGNTNGPIISYLLSGAIWFGAPATEFTSRFVLWVCVCGIVSGLYVALRQFLEEPHTRLALLPVAVFFAFNSNEEFLHYSSETVPLLLLCIALALLARAWVRPVKVGPGAYLMMGLLLGVQPYAKLQGAPPALAVGIMAVYVSLLGPGRRILIDSAAKIRFGWLIGGVTVASILSLGPVLAVGAGRDFWISYIEASRFYIGSGSQRDSIVRLLGFETFGDFSMLEISSVWVLLMALVVNPTRLRGEALTLLISAVILCTTGGIAVITPGTSYGHYLAYLIPGLACLAAAGARHSADGPVRAEDQRVFGFRIDPFYVTTLFLLCITVVAAGEHRVFFDKELRSARKVTLPTSDIVTMELRRITKPGEMMAIWGWMPQWYVATGLAPGTRDAVCPYTLRQGPYMDYFQRRFLDDMKRSRPVLFVDAASRAVSFYPLWSADPRHEMYPELVRYLEDQYVLYRSISPSPRGAPIRIYMLKDRLPKS
ncbi:MAG TPA: hypothetical protein VK968_10305 [Roseimicrobium sp.]|nr:hypothetical protein [Roseimicrobium sp.]